MQLKDASHYLESLKARQIHAKVFWFPRQANACGALLDERWVAVDGAGRVWTPLQDSGHHCLSHPWVLVGWVDDFAHVKRMFLHQDLGDMRVHDLVSSGGQCIGECLGSHVLLCAHRAEEIAAPWVGY